MQEGLVCGAGTLGTPTGGTLTLEPEAALSGTLSVNGKTFGSTSFSCTRNGSGGT